jgi:predicted dehydrogenase
MAHRIGLVGLGQIVQKQHLPAIAASPDFTLVAAASLAGEVQGVPVYRDHMAMLRHHPEIKAVVVCTPPRARRQIAVDALMAGRHVLLEKPPAASLGEFAHIARVAKAQGRVLFASWHSQHNAAVERAREMLAGQDIASMHMDWKENFHKYHPGQRWIWDAGGFGVFDMAINKLSIMSRIFDPVPYVLDAELRIPSDAAVASGAEVRFGLGDGAAQLTASFEWDWKGDDLREVTITTKAGTTKAGTTKAGQVLALTASGGRLAVDGVELVSARRAEYRDLYACFAGLLAGGHSSLDVVPLRLVADILLQGRPMPAGPIGL